MDGWVEEYSTDENTYMIWLKSTENQDYRPGFQAPGLVFFPLYG